MAQQLILNVENTATMQVLKRLVSLMDGVSVISAGRAKKSAYEISKQQAQRGEVNAYATPQELFDHLGI